MECPICLEPTGGTCTITTSCRHTFCLGCFMALRETTCPLCRHELRDELPNAMLQVMQVNTRPSRGLNIHNQVDFPPLGVLH